MYKITREDVLYLLNFHPEDECRGDCIQSLALMELLSYMETGLTPEECNLYVKTEAKKVSKKELELSIENADLNSALDKAVDWADIFVKALRFRNDVSGLEASWIEEYDKWRGMGQEEDE